MSRVDVSAHRELSGRAALVTGGSKGLGRAMAGGLAAAGARVVLVGRTERDLVLAAKDIAARHDAVAEYVCADLSRPGESARVADAACQLVGGVDILINNAGGIQVGRIEEVTDEGWEAVLALNLTATMALTRAVAPYMSSTGWGRIINISSISAFRPREGRAAYASSKAAVIGLTRACAVDLGRFGITVNALAPGFIITELASSVMAEDVKQQFIQQTALRRPGSPEDLIGPMLLLASDAGAYVTGEVIAVDGGWLIGS